MPKVRPEETPKTATTPPKPKLTNRGGAGLYGSLSDAQKAGLKKVETPKVDVPHKQAAHRITPGLQQMAVPLDSVKCDPDNARLHPERNMESIKDSLRLFGQTKPIVVNKRTNVVAAGNGTLQAAKELGWTEIAANFVEMTEAEHAAYGLADNRTAELAKWDFEVVARLDKLIQAEGWEMPGWSPDELEVLRAAEWSPPPVSDEVFGSGGTNDDPLVLGFDPDEYADVGPAIAKMRAIQKSPEMSQSAALRLICLEWSKAESCGRLENLEEQEHEDAPS